MARLIPERNNRRITRKLVLALVDPEARAMAMFALLSGFVIQMAGLHPGPMPAHALEWLARALQGIDDEGADARML